MSGERDKFDPAELAEIAARLEAVVRTHSIPEAERWLYPPGTEEPLAVVAEALLRIVGVLESLLTLHDLSRDLMANLDERVVELERRVSR